MIQTIKNSLKVTNTQLVVVSKRRSIEAIQEKYDQGHRIFGENRVQEVLEKKDKLPDDIEWHLIGHLQTNKVKFITPFVSMIHSVDSEKLLKEIDAQARKNERTIEVLLQFKIAQEESKYGLNLTIAKKMLTEKNVYKNIKFCGVMGMATFTEKEDQVRKEFRKLKFIFEEIKSDFFENDDAFKEISMGMSGDYKIAVEEGSTMVRIGSLLFA